MDQGGGTGSPRLRGDAPHDPDLGATVNATAGSRPEVAPLGEVVEAARDPVQLRRIAMVTGSVVLVVVAVVGALVTLRGGPVPQEQLSPVADEPDEAPDVQQPAGPEPNEKEDEPQGPDLPTEPVLSSDVGITHLADGRHLGFLESVGADGRTLAIDLAVWFSVPEANRAAAEDGETEIPVPNDYYIRNLDPTILQLPVSHDVVVTSVWFHYETDGLRENQPISYEDLLDVMRDDPQDVRAHLRSSPWWVTVDNGVIVALDEQYVP
jgi:hypothetical protein